MPSGSRIPIAPGDHVRVNRGAYFHHGIVVPPGPLLADDEAQGLSRTKRRAAEKKLQRKEKETGFPDWSPEPQVVHYVKGPDGNGKGRLRRTSIADFLGPATKGEVVFFDIGMLPPQEVVHRALAHVGVGQYFLLDHNCEHFSTWCSTGHWASTQVAAAADATGLAAFVVPQLAIVSLVLASNAEPPRKMPKCDSCDPPHEWRMRVSGGTSDLAQVDLRLKKAEEEAVIRAMIRREAGQILGAHGPREPPINQRRVR